MLAKTKKIYAILSILFLLVSYVFSPAYAVKASENTNEISTYVQISQDTAPVKNAETAEVIGELTKGLILKAAKLEGDRVYFQWGKELAYIDATNTQTVDPSPPFEAYSYDTNDSTIPYIQTKEKTAIRSQANDIIGYFIEGSQYPIFRELENSFEIIIGNQLAYIEKSPAITVVQNEEISPAGTENKLNPQTNATNQVDSTSNQQSNATEEKSEATQVKTQPSTTTRASIASIEQTEATTFTASTKYFKVTTDKLAIYDNSTGNLVQVGSLEKGQEFPRVKDYGNWHQIQFGTKYAYVWKGSTAPSDGKSPMQLGTQPSGTAVFTATADLPVYDNSTGTLIHIATIKQGQSYPIVRDYGNWYEILISGRIGYVHKSGTRIDFKSSDRYFRVITDHLAVYDNSTGTLVQVGSLEKGQEFPRVKDYGNWHQIQFGTKYAYVWKGSTAPSDGKSPMQLGTQPSGTAVFTATADLPVYDNSTGTLIHIATIKQGQSYPIVRDYGNWYEILISGRIGYVHKSGTRIDFKSSDRYFRVITDHLAVYDNSTGTLVQVGSLEKGQEFPRVKDYGNWHQIKYGKGYGFVWKASTEPSNGSTIQNINSLAPSGKTFTTITDVPVYDNSSGQLVKFATIQKGVSYPILKDYGNWYVVDVSGRTGYVHKNGVKLSFTSTDRYFEVIEDRVPIYDNSTGKLVPVAYLEKGQVFPRLRDFGNWHEVKYGRSVGYVWKESTRPPVSVNLKNENNGAYKPTNRNFLTLVDVPVVDNSSGSLVQFATIKEGQSYPIIEEVGNWIKIELAGRIGYVYKAKVHIGPIIRYTQYNLSLEQMLNIQMTKNPQTDLYPIDKSYVHSSYIQVKSPNTFPTKGTVTATTLNVREGAGTTYWVVGTLRQGAVVDVLGKVGDWYKIKFGPWKNAKPEDVRAYLDPSRFSRDSKEYFQFLVLSESAGVPVNDLNNKILANKGILAGKGQAFIDAGSKYHINEIYLISHALLETGNGTSALANGVLVNKVDGKPVEPKKVYNMYGIGAYDSCPISCGAEYAYKQGWFTPEAAIIGGAGYIASQYINNPTYKQDTLYKMRWNPANPGVHQYATDIGWAVKQVRSISQLYDLLDSYTLIFDVPVYK